MFEFPLIQRNEEHLRLLGIFHYVGAGLAGLFACFQTSRLDSTASQRSMPVWRTPLP